MGKPAHDVEKRPDWLARALKGLRRLRGVLQPEAARLSGMRPRTYEDFEAGRGPLNIDRIHDFAHGLRVDPHAIVIALEIGSPDFAVRCADNKLATVLVMQLQAFDEAVGDAITQLDTQTLRSTFEQVFEDLAELARARAAMTDPWLKGSPEKPRGPDKGPF